MKKQIVSLLVLSLLIVGASFVNAEEPQVEVTGVYESNTMSARKLLIRKKIKVRTVLFRNKVKKLSNDNRKYKTEEADKLNYGKIKTDIRMGKEKRDAFKKEGKEVRTRVRSEREKVRGEFKNEKKEVRTRVRSEREKVRGEFKNDRERIRNEFRKEKEEIRNKRGISIEKFKKRRTEALEKFKGEKETLKNKLKNIKNIKKTEAVLRIADNINKINIRATDRLSIIVNKLEDILGIIKVFTNKLEGKGLDVLQAKLSITEIENSISNTKELIETQAGKTYEINVTDENTLREVVRKTRDEFRNNVKTTYNQIKTIHRSIKDVIKELRAQNKTKTSVESNNTTNTDSATDSTGASTTVQ